MTDIVRTLPWRDRDPAGSGGFDAPAEWLVANGLGGYASGTVPGQLSRRYHGALVAALPVPLGRVMMLNLLVEHVRLPDGLTFRLGDQPVADGDTPLADLVAFRLEFGLPVWRYQANGVALERRLVLLHGQNTVLVDWRLCTGAESVRLLCRPYLHIRPHDARVSEPDGPSHSVTAFGDHYEIAAGNGLPALRLLLRGGAGSLVLDGGTHQEVTYPTEARRGYDSRGPLWSPGRFEIALEATHGATLIASVEGWDALATLRPGDAIRDELARRRELIEIADPALRATPINELVIAADAFVITPARDTPARVVRGNVPPGTIIAGYHWFTDWGRDTMISLEGLTMLTGRLAEAGSILRTFAHHVRHGLIPNLFPEHDDDGLYNTADATLWFFHAIDRYTALSGDVELLRDLLPTLVDIVERHRQGTDFGIGVDPADGLLRQGAEGLQLTWMDAKVGDWVVTPRRGKAVEINALWYNALRLLSSWVGEQQYARAVPPLAEMADRAERSFNQRFWYADGGYLYDVVDGEHGDDPRCRPNQVFALSLRHPVLAPERWPAVMEVVEQRLLTPVGLRSLAVGSPDYKPRYDGDLRARDAAYHQGTVWGWLIGPFIDAWIRLHPEARQDARRFLDGFWQHLDEAGVGTVSEIFDAEPPFTARGCIAQAWSVAELLRAWKATA